jgi:hypothetical protein
VQQVLRIRTGQIKAATNYTKLRRYVADSPTRRRHGKWSIARTD